MEENILYLTRFCGVEQYPMRTAVWHIIEGDGTEDDPDMLCLEAAFDVGKDLHEDTAFLEAEPFWKINFYQLRISEKSLRPGFCLEQPNENQDVDGTLYYTEHQPAMENRMEIMAVEGSRLKIRLTGVTEDVNYYDGSKPKTRMELVGWFYRKK